MEKTLYNPKAGCYSQADIKYCSKCQYRAAKSRSGSGYTHLCDYITFTDTSRGCKGGYGCEKRVIGKRLKTDIFSNIFVREDYREVMREALKNERISLQLISEY